MILLFITFLFAYCFPIGDVDNFNNDIRLVISHIFM